MKEEIWKPIPDYEKFYEASTFGNIRTIERILVLPERQYLKKQKVLKGYYNTKGYLNVKLYDGLAKGKSITIHRVIALTFLENPNNYKEVNHIDYDKSNNSVENLEWCSRSHNVLHAYKGMKLSDYSGSARSTKLKEADVLKIRQSYKENISKKELSKKYNVVLGTIDFIINRQTWKHI